MPVGGPLARRKGDEMRRIGLVFGLGLAALLLSPGAALAGVFAIDPERLNGTFDFDDRNENPGNNSLEFEIDGRSAGVAGVVRGSAGVDLATITYDTGFPTQLSANARNASLKQGNQVRVSLALTSDGTPVYFGEAAPDKCKVQAKLHDPAANNQPDDPNKAQAKLVCDLGRDWSDLLPTPPSPTVLEAVEAAFDSRKDVKVKASSGKLQIKHNGEPVEPE
jgi:hypothetical protein